MRFCKEVTVFYVVFVHLADTIYWKLKTKPAFFGKTIDLECQGKDDGPTEEYTGHWYRGEKSETLCMNTFSSDDDKYICKAGKRDNGYFSILTITNLSTSDVNIPYICSYGFRRDNHILELSEETFEYQPREVLPKTASVHSCSEINFNLTFEQIFPVPVCSGTYGSQNITEEIHVKNMIIDKLYKSQITVKLTGNVLKNGIPDQLLSIKCIIGSQEKTVAIQHVSCYEKGTNNKYTLWFIIAFLLLLVMIGIIVKVTRFCKSRNADRDEQNKNQTPLVDHDHSTGNNLAKEEIDDRVI